MAITLAATVVVAAGIIGLGATDAAAQSNGDPSGGPGVNSCNPSNAWAVLTGTRGNWAAICGGPDIFDVSKFGPFTDLTIRVTNRVWLHQTYKAMGWADCFSTSNPTKVFDLSGRDQNPGDMQVSSNTSPCS